MPEIGGGLERPIITFIVEFRQFRGVVRRMENLQIVARRIVEVAEDKACAVALNLNLPDAARARADPIRQRPANAREHSALCARLPRSFWLCRFSSCRAGAQARLRR